MAYRRNSRDEGEMLIVQHRYWSRSPSPFTTPIEMEEGEIDDGFKFQKLSVSPVDKKRSEGGNTEGQKNRNKSPILEKRIVESRIERPIARLRWRSPSSSQSRGRERDRCHSRGRSRNRKRKSSTPSRTGSSSRSRDRDRGHSRGRSRSRKRKSSTPSRTGSSSRSRDRDRGHSRGRSRSRKRKSSTPSRTRSTSRSRDRDRCHSRGRSRSRSRKRRSLTPSRPRSTITTARNGNGKSRSPIVRIKRIMLFDQELERNTLGRSPGFRGRGYKALSKARR